MISVKQKLKEVERLNSFFKHMSHVHENLYLHSRGIAIIPQVQQSELWRMTYDVYVYEKIGQCPIILSPLNRIHRRRSEPRKITSRPSAIISNIINVESFVRRKNSITNPGGIASCRRGPRNWTDLPKARLQVWNYYSRQFLVVTGEGIVLSASKEGLFNQI